MPTSKKYKVLDFVQNIFMMNTQNCCLCKEDWQSAKVNFLLVSIFIFITEL